jgi:hypothetical protein
MIRTMRSLKIVTAVLGLLLAFAIVRPVLLAQGTTQINYEQPVNGTLDNSKNRVEYSFAGLTGDKVTIEMNALQGNLDPFLNLYDPQGRLIGEDDNGGGKDNARLSGIVLASDGVYKVVAANKRANASGKFSLIVMEEQRLGTIYYDGASHEEAYQLSQPWDHTEITYSVQNTQPGFNPQDVRATIAQAFQAWANVTPLTFREVTSGRADLTIQFSPIDGALNVLGQACPPSSPCAGEVQFDSEEPWVLGAPSGGGSRQISFIAVATHEFGHTIGLLHSNDSSALMYAAYSPYNLQPGPDDVRGAQALYGSGTGRVDSPTSPPSTSPEVRDSLNDSKWAQFWDFDVNAGETVTLTMRSVSGGLDPFLVLLDANNHILAYDDDGAGGRDAVLRNITLPQSGSYTVAATRYQQAQGYTSGEYVLTIEYGRTNAPPAAQPTVANPPSGGSSGTVRVSAGQDATLQQLPSLDSVVDGAFDDSPTPVTQTRNATVQRSQSYTLGSTWCATDQATLTKNLPNIDVKFAVNGSQVDSRLVTRTQPQTSSNGLSCADYFVVLSDWAAGSVTLTKTMTLKNAVFDGITIYAPGDYVYQYNVQAQ